jgi:N-acetylmuramoyl-L-alanine amidase
MLYGMRKLGVPMVMALVALFALASAGAVGQDAERQLLELTVGGSPYVRGAGEPIEATVTLAAPAHLRLEVLDFDGRVVRVLFDGRREAGTRSDGWHARDADLARLANGVYRILATATATADAASEVAEAWVTVADRAVYPRQPGFITIAIDPGHGGSYDGAVGADGTREADINLDIGLRLARMLEGAGVKVVITRTTDDHVNEPPEDRSGDGVIDGTDELAARPDEANSARADVFLSIHNNIAVNESVGGPSTFYFDERAFASRSARLAGLIQEAMLAALDGIVNGDWTPYDHGALVYPYYVLRDYDPPRLQRPTQMPGVLSEGMFLSNERELALLERPAVRAAMATAYYDALAMYLERRGAHVGYELIRGPVGPTLSGEALTYTVEVRNQGSEPIRDWRLQVSYVAAPDRYVGRVRKAEALGEARIPRLEPGRSEVIDVPITTPGTAGHWMLLFDARDRDGTSASESGSPMLQERLTTFDLVGPSASALPVSSTSPAAVAAEPPA